MSFSNVFYDIQKTVVLLYYARCFIDAVTSVREKLDMKVTRKYYQLLFIPSTLSPSMLENAILVP